MQLYIFESRKTVVHDEEFKNEKKANKFYDENVQCQLCWCSVKYYYKFSLHKTEHCWLSITRCRTRTKISLLPDNDKWNFITTRQWQLKEVCGNDDKELAMMKVKEKPSESKENLRIKKKGSQRGIEWKLTIDGRIVI